MLRMCSLYWVIAIGGVLLATGCKKARPDKNEHPPTAECTRLKDHLLQLASKQSEKFEGIPDTPQKWAERWEWKCRAERVRVDVECLMKADSQKAVAHCPERAP